MAASRFLKRLSSRLFGWGRNSPPAPEPARRRIVEEGLVDPVLGRPRFTEEQLADPLTALAKWIRADGEARPTRYAQACIDALESRYDIRIPEDFRRYLLEVAPRDEFTDNEMTAWWAAGRIRNLPDEYEHGSNNPAIAAEEGAYLFFADYLIWCWAWAVCCSDGPNRGRVAFIGGRPDGFVADSFSEFVERYLREPDEMANTFPTGDEGKG